MRAKFFFKSISVAAIIVTAVLLTTYPNHFFAGGNVTAMENHALHNHVGIRGPLRPFALKHTR